MRTFLSVTYRFLNTIQQFNIEFLLLGVLNRQSYFKIMLYCRKQSVKYVFFHQKYYWPRPKRSFNIEVFVNINMNGIEISIMSFVIDLSFLSSTFLSFQSFLNFDEFDYILIKNLYYIPHFRDIFF
jgi:hypothetical protein